MALFPTGPLVRAPRTTATRRSGLFDVAPPQSPGDNIWMVGGVNWEDYLCTDITSFLDVCPPTTGFVKPLDRSFNFCHADPFQAIGAFDCSVGGRVRQYKSGEAFEIARQRLLQWEQHKVEQVFWSGVTVNGNINPSLQDGNDECVDVIDITPGGGAAGVVSSLAALEDALAAVVPIGIIHVTPGLATWLQRYDLIEIEGNVAYTINGTPVVIGAGYPGTGPGNVAPAAGSSWMFGTGPVGVWESPVFMVPENISQSIDRSVNDITVYAEKYFAVGYTCASIAVNVTLS